MENKDGHDAIHTSLFPASPNEQMQFYDQWAKKYESDTAMEGYNANANILPFCLKWLKPNEKIVDVCAGTGLMGQLLRQHEYKNIDAQDGSEKMLALAKKTGAYKNFYCELIEPGKSSKKIQEGTYDSMVTVGSFLPGHLNSEHLPELLRMVKKGGRLVIGMRKSWLQNPGPEFNWPYDMQKAFDEFEKLGKWRLLEKETKPNFAQGVDGVHFVFEKL